jgi:hypothetical protein
MGNLLSAVISLYGYNARLREEQEYSKPELTAEPTPERVAHLIFEGMLQETLFSEEQCARLKAAAVDGDDAVFEVMLEWLPRLAEQPAEFRDEVKQKLGEYAVFAEIQGVRLS